MEFSLYHTNWTYYNGYSYCIHFSLAKAIILKTLTQSSKTPEINQESLSNIKSNRWEIFECYNKRRKRRNKNSSLISFTFFLSFLCSLHLIFYTARFNTERQRQLDTKWAQRDFTLDLAHCKKSHNRERFTFFCPFLNTYVVKKG